MAKIGLDAYLSRIDTLISENSLEQALYHCFYLLRQFPKFLSVYKQIGRIYFEMNQLPAAANIYSRILSAEPDNFLNHLTMGLILENLQLIDQAIYQTRAALFLQPENKDVIVIYHRLTAQKKGFAEPRHYETLLAGLHAYSEGDYEKVLEELSKYQSKEYKNLKLLYQALSMFECNRDEEGALLTENILAKNPWLQTALRKIAIYSNGQNALRFSEYLAKLTELNPAYAEYAIEGNNIHPGKKFPLVTYQDWTGFQNSRLRTVWQQPGSKIIESGVDSIPDWLKLIPASDLLYNEEQNGTENNAIATEDSLQLFVSDRKRLLPEEDAFFQKDYFQSQVSEPMKMIIHHKPARPDEQPVTILEDEASKGLDDAFDLLEKIASEGIETGPQPETDEPSQEPAEEQAGQVDLSENDSAELIRKAWNFFSMGDQDQGILLYQELVSKNIKAEQVQDDLRKLIILFPENEALIKLQTRQE